MSIKERVAPKHPLLASCHILLYIPCFNECILLLLNCFFTNKLEHAHQHISVLTQF